MEVKKMNDQMCYNIWKIFYSLKTFAVFLSIIPAIIIKNLIGIIGAIPLVDLRVIEFTTD